MAIIEENNKMQYAKMPNFFQSTIWQIYLFYDETIEATDIVGNHFRINIWHSAALVISGDGTVK